ncbi:HAD family phosphatase [Saccharopolyspora halophila]|uniref:HAD family phosphatase n=1 Tax=Saccharopolyspora halophila TaxID=405551 RepID=A0ABN3FR42_9PSEU
MGRWVVFDYGEVISRRTAELPSLAALLQVGAEDFERAYWAERDRYDQGLPDADYWRAVAARVGRTVDDALVARLTTRDVEGWLNTDPATIALLDELRGQGVPLAMLSNASSTFGRAVERQPWAPWFEHLLFSGDLGIAKPDPRIWRILTDALGAAPEDCSFFDDREDNIAAARAAGIDAHLWESAAEAKRLIEEI